MIYIYSKVVITIERLDSVEPVTPSLPAACREAVATRCTDSCEICLGRQVRRSAWPCDVSSQSVHEDGYALWKRFTPLGRTIWPIFKKLGGFMPPNILQKCFKFDVICFTYYRFIAEKPRHSFTANFSVHPVCRGVTQSINQSINQNCYSGLSGNRHCKDH